MKKEKEKMEKKKRVAPGSVTSRSTAKANSARDDDSESNFDVVARTQFMKQKRL